MLSTLNLKTIIQIESSINFVMDKSLNNSKEETLEPHYNKKCHQIYSMLECIDS